MREIKFRVYCNKLKEFVRIVDLGLFGTGKVKSVAFTYKDDPYERIDCDLPGDVELMQYTGLKDKNGVDIYEGNILKVFVLDNKGPHAKVKLKNGMFGIEDDMFGYGFYKGHYSLHQISSRYDAEVIVNVHENPELIGDSQ